MRSNLKWLIPFGMVLLVVIVYLFPVPRVPFEQLYKDVEPGTMTSLKSFRQRHPPQRIEVNGVSWQYAAFGQGEESVLFLHGMTGAYDIWWQQMEALQDRNYVVSVTYPPVDNLEALSHGTLAILRQEGIQKVNLVGSSLGGYLTQYLIAAHPERVKRAVLANTFPPNDLIAEKNRTIGSLLPYMPTWVIMYTLRSGITQNVYPASGNSDLVLAFLLEQTYGRMSKSQVVGRFRCVIDPFRVSDPERLGIPVMIIQTDNDPLIEPVLREELKTTYPTALVRTLHSAGHFPYLNATDEYTRLLEEFLRMPRNE